MGVHNTQQNMVIWEDGGEIGGSGVHFPSTPVKHLADLRSRANRQRYSSIYEDRRPKIENMERARLSCVSSQVLVWTRGA